MSADKEIKRRIKSIQNTAKITKAMELISTIKMKKAQTFSISKREYIIEILKVFYRIEWSLKNFPFFKENKSNKTLAVIISSNKGLCWSYNINTFKSVNKFVKSSGKTIEFVAIWKKAAQFVARTWWKLVADFSSDFTDNLEPAFVKNISRYLIQEFLDWSYKEVIVFYNHFVNIIKQIPVTRKYLSISKSDILEYMLNAIWINEAPKHDNLEYDMEPSPKVIAMEIIPIILDMMFYDIILQAKASEHASRMISMKNAKDNANKFSVKLTLKYNKARQGNITKEISEIVWWVESMKN